MPAGIISAFITPIAMQFRPLLAKLDTLAATLQSPLLLVIRLYWGISFAQSGIFAS